MCKCAYVAFHSVYSVLEFERDIYSWCEETRQNILPNAKLFNKVIQKIKECFLICFQSYF